jgi:hypothetical protein
VRVDREVATPRVEVVQLLGVAALPGLAVGAALVIDRGAVRLGVQVRVTAARRRIEAAAVDRGGRALGADVVWLRGVGLVEQRALGKPERGLLRDVLRQIRPP